MAKRFKVSVKKVQQITKSGLVERNLANGDVKNISKRTQNFELRGDNKAQDRLYKDRTIKSKNKQRTNIPRNTAGNSSASAFKPESGESYSNQAVQTHAEANVTIQPIDTGSQDFKNTANIVDSKETKDDSNIKNYERTERGTLKIRAFHAVDTPKPAESAAVSSENPIKSKSFQSSAADIKNGGGEHGTNLIFKDSENTTLKFTKDESPAF